MSTKKIAVLVGSLRKESFSRKMAKALVELAPESLKLEITEIAELQMYNQDRDETPPPAWTQFRHQLRSSDGFLFVTPEYNRSVPSVLKNAIDVGSRPYGKSEWEGKPGAIVSISIGALGGFGANHHLRQSLVFLNVPTMQQPEAYVTNAEKLFNDKGYLTNKQTREYMQIFIDSYAKWVEKISPHFSRENLL